MDAGDNQQLLFAIIDKVNARVFVFDASGQLRGSAAVLLGLTRGDDPTPSLQLAPAKRVATPRKH